jgi:Heterokaryon incompatibility protein (HET)
MFSTARDEEILLDRCRRCADGFVHTFMNCTTKIIAGIPQTDDYSAISYVWGDYIQLPMRSSHCGHSFHIPMQSAYKFRRLMTMTANSGDTVWLDALPIDQTSKEGKYKLIAVMGHIYTRARRVAVLFPEADGDGFKIVYDLAQTTTAINANKLKFSQPG